MHVFIDFCKLETENNLLHIFSFLHKLSFENNFCFLPVLSCQTSFLVSKIENCFWKQKIREKKQLLNIPLVSSHTLSECDEAFSFFSGLILYKKMCFYFIYIFFILKIYFISEQRNLKINRRVSLLFRQCFNRSLNCIFTKLSLTFVSRHFWTKKKKKMRISTP